MKDLERNVWCLLGLPFDAIDMNGAVDRVYEAVNTRKKCFISTPNLNFLIASQNDVEFRDSVINSDLSVADGQPIIWLARILNIPLPEKVAGSDLIERLIENKQERKTIKVFFFGGEDGVAEQASIKLNDKNKGLECVGFYNPGFGSVNDMSTPDIIDEINKAYADFIIVSLGAKKGQAWIEENKNKIEAPVISHLGAVVNFIAGNVKRSPKIMQKIGLEWVWRIKEEPLLWKRYFFDGMSLLNLIIKRIMPYRFLMLNIKNIEKPLIVKSDVLDNKVVINIGGIINGDNLTSVKVLFENISSLPKHIYINLDKAEYVDSAFIGFLILLHKNLARSGKNVSVTMVSRKVKKIFFYNNAQFLLNEII